MAENTLEPGQVRTGQLFDGSEDTPIQSGTLTYTPGRAPELHIPYVEGEEQFRQARGWFRDREPPSTLIFRDEIGPVTLSGLQWRGHSGGTHVLGRLRADVTVFELPRVLKDEYKFGSVSSKIDGLDEFAHFRSINADVQYTDSGHKAVVTVEAKDSISWRQSGFTFKIRAIAPWNSGDIEFVARAGSVIETRTSRRATVNDHVTAQWPLRALLILAHGHPLFWRSHHISDEQFPTWMMAGPPREAGSRPMIFRRTVRDHEQPLPERSDLIQPMFHLKDLRVRGLRKWIALYQDEVFRRAIEPTVEVINGASRFLEPQILMTVLGLDAMGYFRDPLRKSGVPLHRQIERCITATNADWSSIGPNKGIAKAIANLNNDLKHPDRKNRPDSVELNLIADLAILIMRLQLFDLLELPEHLRTHFLGGNATYHALEAFALNGVKVDPHGNFVR